MLGHPGRVGTLYDGSLPAKKALDIYAETRDEILRMKDWPFALRQVSGVSAASTVSGWAHSWNYPSDCLRVRSIAPQTIVSPDFDPQPVLWGIFNDQTQVPPTKVITSQITPITINYVGQITDMTTWEPLFVNALAQALSIKLGPSLRNEIAPQVSVENAINVAAGADDMAAPNDEVLMLTQEKRK